jgi:hypothetical protein
VSLRERTADWIKNIALLLAELRGFDLIVWKLVQGSIDCTQKSTASR